MKTTIIISLSIAIIFSSATQIAASGGTLCDILQKSCDVKACNKTNFDGSSLPIAVECKKLDSLEAEDQKCPGKKNLMKLWKGDCGEKYGDSDNDGSCDTALPNSSGCGGTAVADCGMSEV